MNSTKFAVNPAAMRCVAAIAVSLIAVPVLAVSNASEAPIPPEMQQTIVEANPAPSAAEIRSMMTEIIHNQHHNDEALQEFERTEHIVTHKDGDRSAILSDRNNRLIPSGTGVTRFEVARNGTTISREDYREHLQIAIAALELVLQPNEREKQDLSKFDKRQRERSEAVDTTLQAFQATWAGRETRDSRTLVKFLLQPNPGFKPNTRLAEVFRHVQATLWVDESKKQIARIEGDITSDVPFGAGIVGKLYRGGHFVIEQSEVGPGVWEPSFITEDVRGRAVFVGLNIHETTETTHYRHLGPPQQALEILRGELSTFADASNNQ